MPRERLAIDGKSIRCTVTDYSRSYQDFISTVSVYSHQRAIVLRMQPISNKKISEVAIVQQLISEFCGQQVVFTLNILMSFVSPVPHVFSPLHQLHLSQPLT
ncbi:hypothetical protein IQ277_14815 [Nostocales cyanobacterium LEGE 12452]|nr:hypothetical protein [Nostocales cyanobacterium LEGE 12452]